MAIALTPTRQRLSNAVPAPGLLWGAYPQRPARPDGAGLTAYLLARLWQWRDTAPKRLAHFIAAVRTSERACAAMSSREAAAALHALRARLARDGLADSQLAEALGHIVHAYRRHTGLAPHDNQVAAAHILVNRQLAEMATGEGKTLAAGMAALAAALAGVPVHVITANDYLVARDAETLRPVAAALGLSVGVVTQPMQQSDRQAAYCCPITFCTARELVFDYLRDRLAVRRAGQGNGRPVQLLPGLCMAIIDEADAILIDEARIPLVLAEACEQPRVASEIASAWRLSQHLDAGVHFASDGPAGMRLTPAGHTYLQTLAGAAPPWRTKRRGTDLVRIALVARHELHLHVHYHVRDGKVCLIDDTTGRTADGRSWSGGLQQMVELKEACMPTLLAETRAQMTYQRFFPRYYWLSGMSGTLTDARRELFDIYRLPVQQVSSHRPSRRVQLAPTVFADMDAQWQAVAARAGALQAAGRPVLIGTDTVADSELLSRRLSAAGLQHAVLNARQDRREAALVACAGQAGAITVATSMAGRGTDIALGPGVAAKGGLHVICCQQNPSPRMDQQLIGRCARQGDPGSAEYFIALNGRLLAGRADARVMRALCQVPICAVLLPAGARAATWLLRAAQRREQRRQRRARLTLLRRDNELAGWLSFCGPNE